MWEPHLLYVFPLKLPYRQSQFVQRVHAKGLEQRPVFDFWSHFSSTFSCWQNFISCESKLKNTVVDQWLSMRFTAEISKDETIVPLISEKLVFLLFCPYSDRPMYRLLEINESIMTEMEQIKRWKSNSIDIFVEPNVTVYKGLEAESYNKMVQFLALVLVAQILAFRAGLTSRKRWKYHVSDPNKAVPT